MVLGLHPSTFPIVTGFIFLSTGKMTPDKSHTIIIFITGLILGSIINYHKYNLVVNVVYM